MSSRDSGFNLYTAFRGGRTNSHSQQCDILIFSIDISMLDLSFQILTLMILITLLGFLCKCVGLTE